MSNLSDSVGNLEHQAGESLDHAVQWTARAASEAYQFSRNLMPVDEKYKDLALGATAVVVGAIACKPLISRAFAGGTEEALAARAEGVKMVPLTHENLPQAISAAKEGFRYGGPFLNPAADFKASLDPLAQAARIGSTDPTVEMNAKYWLAVDKEGKVLGTTGLYETGKDKAEAAWMGWMSVRPSYRGQGIGKMLVEFSKEQAAADGKQFLRLYTSTYKGEAAAQLLYEKEGLKLVGREPHPIPRIVQRMFGQKQPLEILFREMKLTSGISTEGTEAAISNVTKGL